MGYRLSADGGLIYEIVDYVPHLLGWELPEGRPRSNLYPQVLTSRRAEAWVSSCLLKSE